MADRAATKAAGDASLLVETILRWDPAAAAVWGNDVRTDIGSLARYRVLGPPTNLHLHLRLRLHLLLSFLL